MLTKEEFQKTYIRMMDSLRDNIFNKGKENCEGVACNNCPLNDLCNTVHGYHKIFDVIEIVEKWGKDHPIITRADKYKEVFGIEPKYVDGDYMCPTKAVRGNDYCKTHTCHFCTEDYWNGEYIEPKKGE